MQTPVECTRSIAVAVPADVVWAVLSRDLHPLLKTWRHLELSDRKCGLDIDVIQRFETRLWGLISFGGGVRVTDIDHAGRWCRGEVIDTPKIKTGTVRIELEPRRESRGSRLQFEFKGQVALPPVLLTRVLARLEGFLDLMGETIAERLETAAKEDFLPQEAA